MPHVLLPRQERDVEEVIERAPAPLRRSDFSFVPISGNRHAIFYQPYKDYSFKIEVKDPSRIAVTYSPGYSVRNEEAHVGLWAEVLEYVSRWLTWVRDQVMATAEASLRADAPEWTTGHLPADYQYMKASVAELEGRMADMHRMGRLLWQTGPALEQAVADAFACCGIDVKGTARGITYDLIADLGAGRRLLIEVTGIDGYVAKGSNKIAQVLAAQEDRLDADRILLVLNAYRSLDLAARTGELLTEDARKVLTQRLDTVVVTTTALFDVWKLSRTDKDAARAKLERLHGAPAGVITSL